MSDRDEILSLRQQLCEMRGAIKRALGILDRNLGHQTEKCYDAVAVLNQAIRESE